MGSKTLRRGAVIPSEVVTKLGFVAEAEFFDHGLVFPTLGDERASDAHLQFFGPNLGGFFEMVDEESFQLPQTDGAFGGHDAWAIAGFLSEPFPVLNFQKSHTHRLGFGFGLGAGHSGGVVAWVLILYT